MVEQDSNMLFRSALWDYHSVGQVLCHAQTMLTLGATRSKCHSHVCNDLFKHAKVLVKPCLRAVLLSIRSTLKNAHLHAKPSP